jgi:tetratricopeptide (TPR) repeat protein
MQPPRRIRQMFFYGALFLVAFLTYHSAGAYRQGEQSSTLLVRPPAEETYEAYRDRGKAFFELGNYDRAIEDYNHAMELYPEHGMDILYYRGNAYYYKRQYELAIQDYNAALEIDPYWAGAYYMRGNAYADLGDYEQATTDMETAIAADPDLGIYYEGRSYVNYRRGHYFTALTNYLIYMGKNASAAQDE